AREHPDRGGRQPVPPHRPVRAVRLPDPVDVRRVPGVLAVPAGRRQHVAWAGLDAQPDGQGGLRDPALSGREQGAHLMPGRITVWGANQLLMSYFAKKEEPPPSFYLALIRDTAPTAYMAGSEL